MSKILRLLVFMSIWDFPFTKEPIWMSRGIHIPFCICAAEEKTAKEKPLSKLWNQGFLAIKNAANRCLRRVYRCDRI